MKAYELFSDGGGERGSTAAAASIIRGPNGQKRFVIALGGATNNESEIFGGLLGLAVLSYENPGGAEVVWCSDSEYTLKSATEYIINWQRNGWRTASRQAVKNIGLWRTYLPISAKLKIIPQHVRGHSGHPENEECDRICTQVRELQLRHGDLTGEIKARDGKYWRILDGRQIIEDLRNDEPSTEAFLSWVGECAASQEYLAYSA